MQLLHRAQMPDLIAVVLVELREPVEDHLRMRVVVPDGTQMVSQAVMVPVVQNSFQEVTVVLLTLMVVMEVSVVVVAAMPVPVVAVATPVVAVAAGHIPDGAAVAALIMLGQIR